MGLLSWRQWFNRKVRASRRTTPTRDNKAHLRLEELETRLAPVTDMWTGAGALAGGTSNWSNAANWSLGTPTSGEDLSFSSINASLPNASKALAPNNDLSGLSLNSIQINGSGYTIKGNAITLGSTGIFVGQSDANNTISLNIALNSSSTTFNVAQAADVTLAGQLSGTSQLSKQGTGTLFLNHDNSTFNGSVFVNAGILEIGNNNALGNPTGNGGGPFTTTVQTGATLETNNTGDTTRTIKENLLLGGSGVTGTGALYNVAGTSTWAGSVMMFNPTTVGAAASTSTTVSSLNITGVISDSGGGFSLTKEGEGQVILSAANTYRGVTFVNNGTLAIRNAQALGTSDGTAATETVVNSTKTKSGTLQIDGSLGAVNVQSELLVLNGAGYNPGTGALGALDNVSGNNIWNGNITLGSADPNGSNVSIGSETTTVGTTTTVSNLTITGVISDVNPLLAKNSPYSLTKVGPGRITLAPTPKTGNTYLGLTTVADGYLRAADSQALGPASSGQGTVVNIGASLELYAGKTDINGNLVNDSVTGTTNTLNFTEALTINGTGVNMAGGALDSIQGINTWTSGIVLGNGAKEDDIGVAAPQTQPGATAPGLGDQTYFTNDWSLTVLGNISTIKNVATPANLGKVGTGQLILPNANSYTTDTFVQAGWITVENNNSLGTANPTLGDTSKPFVHVASGAAVDLLAPTDPKTGLLTSLSLPQNFIVSGFGITHNNGLISQEGAIENVAGNNTLTGLIQINNGVGIGVENVFKDGTGTAVPSQLTTTGQVSNFVAQTTFAQSATGSTQEADFNYDTGGTSGTVTVNYNMFAVPDDLRVFYQGQLIYDTGLVSGSGTFTVNYGPGTSTIVTIIMNQGGGQTGTVWTFNASFKTATSNASIEKLGSQQLNIQGPGTYTGPLDIKAGVVNAQNSTALGAPGFGGVTVESGAALEISSTIPTDNGGMISGIEVWDKSLILNGTGNVTVTNPTSNSDIAPLTVLTDDSIWRGPITLGNSSTIDVENAARFTVTGVIDDGATLKTPPPAAALTKVGTGELDLAGANTYRGTTFINAGVVTVSNDTGLGSSSAGTVVNSGASLQLQGGITVAGEALTVQGTGAVTATNVTPDWFNLGSAPVGNVGTVGANPANASGRITGVTTDPNDPNTIYISAAGGGGWKTIDGGQTWQPLFDQANQTDSSSVTPMFSGAIAIAPSNANVIYLGTGESDNSGDSFYGTGVYKSIDSGRTWTLLTSLTGTSNPLYGLAISKIVVDPNNANLIYVASSDLAVNTPATGAGSPGVYRYDGTNWFNLTGSISAVRGAAGAPGTPGPDDDFRISFPQSSTAWSDLALANGILYAALGDPQTFVDAKGNPIGDPNNGVFRDENPMSSSPIWYIGDPGSPAKPDAESSKEFPTGAATAGRNNGNIKITAVTIPVAGKPPTVTIYASVADAVTNGLLDIQKSTDGGKTWAAVGKEPADFLSPQGFYDNSIVARNDGIGNTVYVAGVENYNTSNSLVFMTTDGGGTWTDISSDGNGNGPHTDMHSLWLDNQGRLLTGNDGGIWRYDPVAKTWTDLNGNLAITTFNGISADPTDPNRIFGGAQDNGTFVYSGTPNWAEVDGGDGGLVHIDPVNTNIVYHVLNGTLQRSTQGGAAGTWSTVFSEIGAFGQLYFSNVVDNVNTSRLVIGVNDTNTQYNFDATGTPTAFGGPGVYQSLDEGQTWTFIGPGAGSFPFSPLITSVATATYQGNFQADKGFTDVSDIGSNTYDAGTIYGISLDFSGYHVVLTKDLGQTWVDRTSNLPSGLTYESIAVDPRNRDTAYLVTSDPTGTTDSSGNLGGRVFVTTDAGQTWTNVTGNLPDIPTYTLVIDPRTGNLFVGNDNGVYETPGVFNSDGSLIATPSWTRFGVGLPDVQVKVIDLNQTLNTLTVGTYGRSAYQLTLDDAPANAGAFRSIAGTNVWTGTVTLAGNTTISAEGTAAIPNGLSNASLEIVGSIQDGGNNYSVTKTGLGTVIYSGANTYGGTTTVVQGVLDVRNSQGLPTNAGTYVDAGAALDLESNTSAALFLSGDGILFNDHNTGALRSINGSNTASGPITLQSNTTIGVDSGSTLTVTGQISDSSPFSLTKELTGDLILSAANTYNNATFINQGILIATNANSLGANGNTTTVVDGAQLQLDDLSGSGLMFDAADNLILGGTGISNTGALENIAGNNTFAGSITLTSLATPTSFPPTTPTDRVTVNVASGANTLTLSGPIGEASNNGIKDFGIDKIGTGSLKITAANSFTGNTNVFAGALIIEDSRALGIGATSTTTISAGTVLELRANPTGNDSVTGTANIDVNQNLALNGIGLTGAPNGALRNVSGNNIWAGGVTLQSASTISTVASTSLNISGVITDNKNGYTLTKSDNGTLILSGANTYTGQTLVTAGIVNVQNNQGLGGTGNAGTVVSNGATLQLQGGVTVSNAALTIGGQGIGGIGALDNPSGNNTFNNTITLTGNTTFSAEAGSVLTVAGIIKDGGNGYGITKIGAGTVALAAANTYTGTTAVNAGTLLVDGSIAAGASINGGTLGGVGTINGSVAATAAGGTLAPGDNSSTAGVLTVNGNVTLNSASSYFVYILSGNTLTPPPAGFSQLDANGNVSLGGAKLLGALGYNPPRGTAFTVIQTTGSGHSVSGSFSQGATAVIGGLPFDITYNSGNVVLTRDIATTTTTLADSTAPADASVYGQPVVFTATVAPETGIIGAPQGLVDFYVDGVKVDTETLVTDSNNDGNSSASYTYNSSSLIPSPHTVYAIYEGDPSAYKTSTSATVNQTVTKATPTVGVSADHNPAVTGQSITFTATVSPQYTDPNNSLAGTVDFYLGNTLLNNTPIAISGGKASYTLSGGLTADNSTYTITAKFTDAGTDGNFNNASGQLTETVNRDATTTTITSTPNQGTVDYGTATITASVASNGPGSGKPTGSVTFVAVSTDGTTTITDSNEPLNGSDVATMTKLLPVLAVGQKYTVTATYNGDNNYATSSNSLSQTIAKATTSVTVQSSSPNSVYGQKVTFTATVKPEGAGTPTGIAEFIVKDRSGNTVIDDAGIAVINGVATDTTSATALGVAGSVYSVTVKYSGDNNFNSSNGTLAGGQTITTASTSVAVTADHTSVVTGQSVTFTATVSPQFGGTPQGTVEFIVKDQFTNTVLDDKNISLNSSGVATDTTSALVASGSPYTVQVNFTDSDGNFTNNSGTLNGGETVAKAGTTTTVTSASPGSTTTYGTAVTFTATVTVNSPGSGTAIEPGGKVDFYDNGNFLGQGTLNGAGTDQATYSTSVTQLPGGTDQITAKYEGDGNFLTSPVSAIFNQTVNTAGTTTGAVTYTFTHTETPPESSPAVGDTITFKVVVSSNISGIGAPTGTVNFLDGSTVIGTGTLSDNGDGTATATGNVSTLVAGPHSITAQYVSDGNFTASSTPNGSALSLTVIKAGTTTALNPSTSGSEAYGQDLVTVKVTPNTSNSVVPTGQVTFTATPTGGGATITDTQTVNSSGVATLKALLPAGQTYSITASYGGDTNYNTSSTSSALVETVTTANSTTTVTGPATTPVTGQPITFTVTVSAQYNGIPQGTVNLYLGTTASTPLNANPISLDATGKATFTYTPGLAAANAPYNIIATFTDGDGNFNNSDNTTRPLSQAVNQDGTNTSVVSGKNPSNFGNSVTFTATVSAASPGSASVVEPGGKVDFYVNGNFVGQGTLNGASTDQATYTTSATQLPGGSDKITATYEGDNNFLTSTSTGITQTVNAAPTSTGSVSASWTGSTNTPPTIPVSGQQITLSVTVSGGSVTLGSPTGTVDFFDGSTQIGQGTLSDNGDGTSTATTTVTDLLAGSHSITAKYVSDGNFAASKSPSPGTSVTLTQANTSTAVQTSNANATYGQTPVTATVTAVSPGSGTPTGTVTFTATGGGNTYSDTEDLTNGKATMMQLLPVLSSGQSYTITATYNGDSNYNASAPSKSITQSYSTAGDVVTVVSNTDPSISGQAVTFTAIVTPPNGGLPQGTMTFVIDGGTAASGVAVQNGQASFTTSGLGVGTHTVSANYTSSDLNFRNNSGVLAGGQTVNGATPPPPPPPSNSGGGGGGGGSSNSSSSAPAFDFNTEFSLLETDAIYFAYFNQLAAQSGFTNMLLDEYVNYFLQQIYSNPLLFTSSGSYAISLGYEIGIFYFDSTQPQPTA